MRRIAIALTLLAGCFGEPDTVDKVAGTTVQLTTVAADESSSSSDGESSSSEESSSTSEATWPPPCPEWCHNGCDLVGGVYTQCRCTASFECGDDLHCEGFTPEPYKIGHCR